MVVDLSPGSGVAARAAMHHNIEDIGCCSNVTHARWMSNVLDREACALIGHQHCDFNDGEYAVWVNTHFGDVLAQIKGRDEAAEPTNQDPATTA